MHENPYIVFYTLFTGPENPQSQAPLYDALIYIVTNFSKKDKLWKRQRILLSIKEKLGLIRLLDGFMRCKNSYKICHSMIF